MRAQNRKHGARDNQLGVRMGDIRKLAAKIKTGHQMALDLWATGNIDARLLAILLDPWAARAGWSLTSERVARSPDGLDVPALLDRIEAEMGSADPAEQWTMNACLAGIGIHFPKLRKRAIAIGEALGVYRDYPVSAGCTSPFAPIWIDYMVRRKG